jgi:hypothetical protein
MFLQNTEFYFWYFRNSPQVIGFSKNLLCFAKVGYFQQIFTVNKSLLQNNKFFENNFFVVNFRIFGVSQ